MADDGEHPATGQQDNLQESSSQVAVADSTPSPSSSSASGEDRIALLDRARAFLESPTVVHEDPSTKRRFLVEKGLREYEIEGLLREVLPPVPPRTYPQPPPSRLPQLLLGLTKILTWLTGGSAVLILIYYRFLLPQITRSALARRSLKQSQVSHLKRLNASLAELKTAQAETLAVLPSPPALEEPSELVEVHSLEKLGLDQDAPITVPEATLLRCAIEGLSAEGKNATKEELFGTLEERYPWLKTDKGLEYQYAKNSLWETVTTNPAFSQAANQDRVVWSYTAPPPPIPTPFLSSLATLKSTLPPPHSRHQPSPMQRTLDALSDFTGYITTQTYQLASSTMRVPGFSSSGVHLSPQQEEIKKEIRALKGFVLNRRTFAPAAVRPATFNGIASSPP